MREELKFDIVNLPFDVKELGPFELSVTRAGTPDLAEYALMGNRLSHWARFLVTISPQGVLRPMVGGALRRGGTWGCKHE